MDQASCAIITKLKLKFIYQWDFPASIVYVCKTIFTKVNVINIGKFVVYQVVGASQIRIIPAIAKILEKVREVSVVELSIRN